MFLSKKALQESLKLLPIDFKQPWWQLISDQKWLVFFISLAITIVHTFWCLTPFFITKLFESPTLFNSIILFTVWFLTDCLHIYARQLNARFQLQCIHSIYQNAHQHLVTIDPRYHVHRASGAILGKIERGARGYEEILDQTTFEFLPLLIGIIVVTIAVGKYSLPLALMMVVFFVIMVGAGYYYARYACQKWEIDFINTDDNFKITAVENLAQVQLVRASFASDYMSNKLSQKIDANMRSEANLWLSYTTSSFVLNMFYLVSVFSLIGMLAWQIKQGTTTLPFAIGLAVAFFQSTQAIVRITKPFRRYMRGWTAVKDLFDFISNFGKQGYPVLGQEQQLVTKDHVISIKANTISFNYEKAVLFSGHTFKLECPSKETYKLYGIIGKSGSGKTTLLSILGGQLKPTQGNITINGVDIYTINDATRRHLIALQGQIATNVRGTLKYNLLFGLPTNHGYTDEDLLKVLDRVGLLSVLQAHNGLDTMLGEGGLNLSGGQRQRLNFAGLYLRASFYKPLLILIDEPTSSLDELSEAAITHMILELSQNAVTLVIAHRLKTIEKAAGIIDLSLLAQEKEITAYSIKELEQRSYYYQQLMHGKVSLDS